MSTINIRSNDILWWFYCKSFTLTQEKLEEPKNLCRYFWRAVRGFLLWLELEVKLRWTCLGIILLVVALYASAVILPSSVYLSQVVIGFIYLTLLALIFLTMLISFSRLEKWVMVKVPWVGVLPPVIVAVLIGTMAWNDPKLQAELWNIFWHLIKSIPVIVGVAISLIVIILVLAKTAPALGQISRVWETTGQMLKAKKQRICPLVNPPADFAKQEDEP